MYEEIRYFRDREVHVREKGAAKTLCGKRTSSAVSRRKMITILQLGGNTKSKGNYGCASCRGMYANTLARRY